jgi:hypothetical protein
MEMCRGLFWLRERVCQCLWLISFLLQRVNQRNMETHIATDDAEAGDGGYCGRHGVACGL